MSDLAIVLSSEELEMIETRRADKQAKKDAQIARYRQDWDIQVRSNKKDNAAKRTLVDALRAINIIGVFTITESTEAVKSRDGFGTMDIYKPKITFMLNGRDEQVRIEEHRPSSISGYYRTRSNGYKFHMYGGFNDYKDRWYKRAATVLDRVVEMQNDLISIKQYKKDRDEESATNRRNALKVATKTYPNAQIEVSMKSNIVTVTRDDVGTLTLNYVIDYKTKVMTLVFNSVKLADDLHIEILAKFEA